MSTSMKNTPPTGPGGGPVGYEVRDITPRPIVLAALGGVVVVALVFVAMWQLTGLFSKQVARQSAPANPLAAELGPKQPPAPRLQTAPINDIRTLHAAEDQALHGYAWIDRTSGAVRIPIDRAIELLAQRGLPARQPQPAAGESGATP
jgi:hypothetical protein